MRIKINLITEKEALISFDYNYNIYLNIRKVLFNYLKKNKPKYLSKYKNNFPNFTFSQLMIPRRTIQPGFIKVDSNYFSIFISSVDNVFMEYLIKALYSAKAFPIFTNNFSIRKIDIIEPPEFFSPMKFKMLSPLFLAKRERDKIVFLKAEDSDLNEYFVKELMENRKKYFTEKVIQSSIKLTVDQNYLEVRKKTSRFFTIRNINYKTILVPFMLEGDIDLIKFAYDNGIGSKTYYGFGMIEPV